MRGRCGEIEIEDERNTHYSSSNSFGKCTDGRAEIGVSVYAVILIAIEHTGTVLISETNRAPKKNRLRLIGCATCQY